MTKTPDAIREAVLSPKHPFPTVGDRPQKPQKHRYERRKVRQYIQVVDWAEPESWVTHIPTQDGSLRAP
jgi:hypothetical protein